MIETIQNQKQSMFFFYLRFLSVIDHFMTIIIILQTHIFKKLVQAVNYFWNQSQADKGQTQNGGPNNPRPSDNEPEDGDPKSCHG